MSLEYPIGKGMPTALIINAFRVISFSALMTAAATILKTRHAIAKSPAKCRSLGADKLVPRGLHYVCRLGACDYYKVRRNAQQQQISLDADLVNKLASLYLI